MNLLIDAGNSYCKYILLETIPAKTTDLLKPISVSYHELAAQLTELAHHHHIQCIYLTAVSELSKTLDILSACFVRTPIVVARSEAQYNTLKNAYANPMQLGVDRWLAMLGAQVLFPNQLCGIVDIGTAITIDIIQASGTHQGGFILPGWELTKNCLRQNTANIQISELVQLVADDSEKLGLNTQECVAFGFIFGLKAQLKLLSQQLRSPVQWLITGGGQTYLKPDDALQIYYHPNLVLLGLAARYDLISKDSSYASSIF